MSRTEKWRESVVGRVNGRDGSYTVADPCAKVGRTRKLRLSLVRHPSARLGDGDVYFLQVLERRNATGVGGAAYGTCSGSAEAVWDRRGAAGVLLEQQAVVAGSCDRGSARYGCYPGPRAERGHSAVYLYALLGASSGPRPAAAQPAGSIRPEGWQCLKPSPPVYPPV